MVILDKPYISFELKQYLENSQIPVLKNDYAELNTKGFNLNLKTEDEFKKLYSENPKLITFSENSLEWIYQNINDKEKIDGIKLMKNKTEVRKLLKPLYPDFFFMEAGLEKLKTLNFASLKKPFILKPSIGFFSVGVYTISDENSWNFAINDIEKNFASHKKDYTENVVGNTGFIIEEYIKGQEYALDAYYDNNGNAVMLNIFKHDFGSSDDVSDRLYYTSKKIIEDHLEQFTVFLNDVNKFFKVKNFPIHVELRISNNKIIPIEFNPMRFAGWCTTDLSYFAYGFKTYDYFISDKKPDWQAILKDKDEKIYSFILLNKPKLYKNDAVFNYDLLMDKFKKVLNLRKLEGDYPVFGFLFVETSKTDRKELDNILKSDLTEFLKDS